MTDQNHPPRMTPEEEAEFKILPLFVTLLIIHHKL